MTPAQLRWLRFSVVAVWLGTAVVSVIGLSGISRRLLAESGVQDVDWQSALILGASAADFAFGLAMWFKPGRASFAAAMLALILLTATATAMQLQLWWHPLGPLLKNLPMAAVLWVLWEHSE